MRHEDGGLKEIAALIIAIILGVIGGVLFFVVIGMLISSVSWWWIIGVISVIFIVAGVLCFRYFGRK